MPQNLFDANFYRAANSDLRGLNDAQALSHFQQFGLNENRSFSPFVDLNFYRASNSDLASFSNKQAFEHLQKYGVAEGRKFSPLLDLNFYLADNPDVAQAYGGSREGALSHFETYYNLSLSATPAITSTSAIPQSPNLPSSSNSFINRVLELTNAQRLLAGLQPLTLNSKLNNAAQAHSEDMALHDFFDHKGSNGSSMIDRAKASGYQFSRLGENIAAGYATPEDVVQGWLKSPGHRANILNPSYREIGIGYYYLANDTGNVNQNYYWTQDFGVIST